MSAFTRAAGYALSLRPYSWQAIRARMGRRVASRLRRVPLAGALVRDRHNGVRIDGVTDQFPAVDAAWARTALEALGLKVETYRVDAVEFELFLRCARFPAWYHGGGRTVAFLEKALEHYVAAQLLDLGSGDTYLDVGADNSPFSAIAKRLFGCNSYQLDGAYRSGVRGRFIGADVRQVPLDDGSVTKMAAHCAFDHFQGEADRAFVREAARLLAPGGRFCILPLYLAGSQTNFVDTRAWVAPPFLDSDASVIEIKNWGYDFTRYYSPASFIERVVDAGRPHLDTRVFAIEGVEAVDPSCYLRLAAVLERRAA